MPITPAAAPQLAGALAASAQLGMKVPDFALGVTIGLSKWVQTVKVIAPSSGTLGVGQGITPLVVPSPVIQQALFPAFASFAILGPMSPLHIMGLSNGLNLVFLQGLCLTTHPTVGAGGGVVKFTPTPAAPFLIEGLASVGMVGGGPVKLAGAIGMGLNTVFSALSIPCVVAGPPNIVPGAGVGFGQIV